jgi:hypothetical protein
VPKKEIECCGNHGMRIVFLAELTGKTDPMYALIHCGALELMFVIIVFPAPSTGFSAPAWQPRGKSQGRAEVVELADTPS